MSIVRIPLGSRKYPGLFALIDEEDYERVSGHRWHPAKQKRGMIYAVTNIDQKNIPLHRFVVNAPPGKLVDHWSRDGLDNRRANLRLATNAQNTANKGIAINNTSGFKGVTRHRGKWQASVETGGKCHYCGLFTDLAEAARAYDRKAVELFGEFACLNLPGDYPCR